MQKYSLIPLFLVLTFRISAQLSPVYNLSFEKKGINLPIPLNWEVVGNYDAVSQDSTVIIDGKYSLKVTSYNPTGNNSVSIVNRIQAKPFIGNKLKFAGNICTAFKGKGFAQLYIIVLKNGLRIQYANSCQQQLIATKNWTKNEISINVDSSAEEIVIGAVFNGNGQAWFDNFQLFKNEIAIDERNYFPKILLLQNRIG